VIISTQSDVTLERKWAANVADEDAEARLKH